jgi:hypothetical protein
MRSPSRRDSRRRSLGERLRLLRGSTVREPALIAWQLAVLKIGPEPLDRKVDCGCDSLGLRWRGQPMTVDEPAKRGRVHACSLRYVYAADPADLQAG